MKYRLLGYSGLRVSELALGAMTFGTPGWGVDAAVSRQILETYADAGGKANAVTTTTSKGGH